MPTAGTTTRPRTSPFGEGRGVPDHIAFPRNEPPALLKGHDSRARLNQLGVRIAEIGDQAAQVNVCPPAGVRQRFVPL